MRKALDFADFLTWFPPEQAELFNGVRDFLQERYPHLRETIKYGVPFWVGHRPVVYMSGGKEDVYLGFAEGHRMPNALRLLEGDGKVVRKYFLRSPHDLHTMRLSALLEEALAVDEEIAAERKARKLGL